MSYHNILWYPDLGYRCWCTCVLRYTHLWARHSISVATRGGEFVFYFPTNGEDHHPDPVKRRERGVHSSTPLRNFLRYGVTNSDPITNHDVDPLTAWEGHRGGYVLPRTTFSNKYTSCKAVSASIRRFLFLRQFIHRMQELLLEALWGAVRGIMHSVMMYKRSVRLSEALQSVFSLNVKIYAEHVNSRYKSADSLWECFYAALWMWYALWSHHRAYKRFFVETIILPPILSTPTTRALRGWERHRRCTMRLWKHYLEHMYAL